MLLCSDEAPESSRMELTGNRLADNLSLRCVRDNRVGFSQ